jgi:hypothetical protein
MNLNNESECAPNFATFTLFHLLLFNRLRMHAETTVKLPCIPEIAPRLMLTSHDGIICIICIRSLDDDRLHSVECANGDSTIDLLVLSNYDIPRFINLAQNGQDLPWHNQLPT